MTSGMRLAGLGDASAEFPDARRLHLALARWNRRRMAVGRPSANWLRDLDEDQRMLRLEGAFIEAFRAHIAHLIPEVPTSPDGFPSSPPKRTASGWLALGPVLPRSPWPTTSCRWAIR